MESQKKTEREGRRGASLNGRRVAAITEGSATKAKLHAAENGLVG